MSQSLDTMIPLSCLSTSLECGVCYEQYDDQDHRPSINQCSHTFCEQCVNSMIEYDTRCPLCRATIVYHTINLDILRIANDIKETIKKQSITQKKSSKSINQSVKQSINQSSEIDELTDMFNLQLCDLQEQQEQIDMLTNQLQRVQKDVANSRRLYKNEVAYYKSACTELSRRLAVSRAEKQQAHAELVEMRIMNEKQSINQRARTVVTRKPRWLP